MSLSGWHNDVCLICSVSLDCEKQHSEIRAIPTQQGHGILFRPPEFQKKPRRLEWPNFRSTCWVHLVGTLPNAYLVHYHCILFLCWVRGNTPIQSLVSTLPQTCWPCFEPPPSRLEFDIYRQYDHVKYPLAQRLMKAPTELFNAITAYLPPDQALAIAAMRDALELSPRRLTSPYRSSVSEIINSYSSRRRLAQLYDVAFYLQDQNVQVGTRDRVVKLSSQTNAIFVVIDGKRYLHDFCDGDYPASNGRSGYNRVCMGLKNPTQVALMVDEFGIVDIALEEDNGQLQWVLGIEPTSRRIFMERAPTGILSSIEVTYDSVRCRSIRLPCSVAQPRPLLLPESGHWVPWSFFLKTPFTFPHDDYFVPTVTDIAMPDIVYLSYNRNGVISGIHENPEGSQTRVPLGPPAQTRSVKLLVLCHSITLSRIPCIQFINSNRAIPTLPTGFHIQQEEVQNEVKAVWWGYTSRSGFLFNVIK